MFHIISPIKSLFQIAQRYRTSRIFTNNVFKIVKNLLILAILILKTHNSLGNFEISKYTPDKGVDQSKHKIHLTCTTKTSQSMKISELN